MSVSFCLYYHLFFFNDTATTEIYPLSLHDALPISRRTRRGRQLTPPEPSPSWGAALSRAVSLVARPVPSILAEPDRKSTRLNSSHANISYAVFCLKKKKTPTLNSTCSFA